MKYYYHVFMLSSSLFFLFLCCFVSYTHYDNIYLDCDQYNCTYSQTNNGCKVTVIDQDFHCSESPCMRDFPENISEFISPCFMPKGQKECPMILCHSNKYIQNMMATVSITLIDVFLLCLTILYCRQIFLYYRRHKNGYARFREDLDTDV